MADTRRKADPKTSEGARVEREAFRRYLRRELRSRHEVSGTTSPTHAALQAALAWVLDRSKRYGKRPGGLGR